VLIFINCKYIYRSPARVHDHVAPLLIL